MRVLIVGATSAVAEAVAVRLLEQQAVVYCLARNKDRLAALVERLGPAVKGSQCLDFTQTGQVASAVDAAAECLGGIDIALIAHGMLPDQLQSEQDIELVKQTLDCNLLSAIAFLLPLCDLMKLQCSGKIAVITSVAGDRGRPRNFTYAAAKGGLAIYLQGLRSSLWGCGVQLYTVKMGPVDTPMTATHDKNFSFTSTDRAADGIIRALSGRRYEVYVPAYWSPVMWAVRNMPEWLFQRLAFLSAR